jgi:hypothetical protein
VPPAALCVQVCEQTAKMVAGLPLKGGKLEALASRMGLPAKDLQVGSPAAFGA